MTPPGPSGLVHPPYAAVVLAGGTGRRLGGTDKAGIVVGGQRLLDHAVALCAEATTVVVVGPPGPTSRPVQWTRELPAGGGPGAGLLAGLDALPEDAPDLVLVLAVDMPLLSSATVERLVHATFGSGGPVDGSLLVGPDGRRQLAGVLRRGAVLGARPAITDGVPVHRLLSGLDLVEVEAEGDEALDLDTPDDVDRLPHGDQ